MTEKGNGHQVEGETDTSHTILVVEDDIALSRLVQKNLKRVGFHPVGVVKGAEAIARIADRPPTLLLLDYRLPDMTGQQVIESLKARQCNVPFIITTGHGDEQVAVEMMKLGARDYLVKDTNFLDLLPSVVKRVVDQLATEKRLAEAEERLRQSEEKYRHLFEYANDSIFIVEPSTRRFLNVNENAARRLGYSRAELLRLTLDDIDTPAAAAHNEAIIRELQETGSVIFEHAHRRKDGTEMPVEISSRVIEYGGRRVFLSFVRDITKRKRAVQALRESEERYRTLFEGVPVGLYRTTPAGQFVEVNGALVQMLGYPDREALLAVNVAELYVNPEDRQRWRFRLEQEKVVRDFEVQIRQYDGMTIWMKNTGRVVQDAGGRTLYYEGNLEDITQRKRAEEEIRRRNRELAMLNQIIAASVTSLEPEAILETACRELARAFDVPQATATLLNEEKTATMVAAECRAENRLTRLNETMAVRDYVVQYLLTHKGPLVVDDAHTDPRLAPVRDLLQQRGIISLLILPLIIKGEVVGSLDLLTTEIRHFSTEEINLAWSVADQVAGSLASVRLAQTHQLLITAIEQATETVIITDIDDKIIYINPAFEHTTGYNRAEVIGQSPDILSSDKHDEAFFQEMRATMRSGQTWRGRIVNKKKDGTLFTEEATISPIRGQNGDIVSFVEVKRDVTRELQLEEQYHQAQKMEAIGRLAGGVAHDFNNLLTGIMGHAGLALQELPPGDPVRNDIQEIHKNAERAANLTRQLLTFARRQVIAPRVLNLNELILNVDKMLRRLIGEDIELVTLPAPDLGQIKADPGQIEQVLLNLAVNARDAMPDGGKLTIEITEVILDEAYTRRHPEVSPGQYVMLAVSDTGMGMTEEVKAHIFEPFFTTKEVGKGTGLGLATCFGIVRQNNGHIWVYSEPGQGTTFKIYLPRVEETVDSSTKRGQSPSLPRGTEVILLVEDEEAVRDLAARALRRQGYTVLEAANGEEALRLAEEYSGEIHLLLTDVVMPQMGGKALATRLGGIRSKTKILFTSGYTDKAIVHHSILDSDIAFIQKPFSPTTLVYKVREVLDK